MSGKHQDPRVLVGSSQRPLDIGVLIESLQAAGVPTEVAVRVVRDTEKWLRQRGLKAIPIEALVDRLAELVEERVGSESAHALRHQTPPFTALEVERDGEVRPLERSTVVAWLEKAGLPFKDANLLAEHVEQGLRIDGLRRVDERELGRRLALLLEARYGRELRMRYEASTPQVVDLIVVDDGDGGRRGLPFSRGILTQSLMAVGLGPERSHGFANRIEQVLWRRGEVRVPREVLRCEVRRLLMDEAGEEYARRYEIMRRVRSSDRPIVIVIGGTAGVGKSLLAAELAYRLGIARVVSTDSVRQALRSLISAELSPVLHASSYAAWRAELLPSEVATVKPKRKRVLRGYQTQVMQLAAAVDAIIERHVTEATSLVIEGIHLVPGLSPRRLDVQDAVVVQLVLTVSDEDDHRENFGRREQTTLARRPSAPYLDHFAEIRMLQSFLVGQAAREGVSVIETTATDKAVDRTVEAVLDAVKAELGEPEQAA
jgi:2-phosphoglycerate kinase